LKKSRHKIIVEEISVNEDEKQDTPIQETSLKEDEEELVDEKQDANIQEKSVNNEETKRCLITEPPLLIPYVDFTPKNGVAVIAHHKTVKTT
jgi:hypothetical protein